MNVLSIQSWVSYGHVGNAAALFALQRLGAEVWAVHTVQFSNHPGHGDWAGRSASGEEIAALVAGIGRRGAFAGCDAVLSGYMGDPSIADAILGAVRQVRDANPSALFCCDPVIGDAGRIYVDPAIPGLIRSRILEHADLLTPNQFELEQLTQLRCDTPEAVRRAISALRARMRAGGPRVVLLTSAVTDATPADRLDVVAADERGASTVRVPRLPVATSGAGDLLAALFLHGWLRDGRADRAMERAVASVQGLLGRMAETGARELPLIAAQEELVRPSRRLDASLY